MAVVRDKPYSNYNFLVDLGTGDSASPQAGFSEVILPYAAVDVIQYRSGNDKESGVRKIPGRAHYGNVIFKRGGHWIAGSLSMVERCAQRQCECCPKRYSPAAERRSYRHSSDLEVPSRLAGQVRVFTA